MILTHGINSLPIGIDGMTVTIGGRKYPIVQIGNQLWLAQNLDWLYPGLELSTGAWGYQTAYAKTAKYYNDDPTYTAYDGSPIGLYYTAQAIAALTSVLPDGWHVPTMSEIDTLLANAGTTAAEQYKALFALNPFLRSMSGSDTPGLNTFGLNLHLNGNLSQSESSSPGTGSFTDLNTTLGLPSKDITMTDYITSKRLNWGASSNDSSWAKSFTVRLVKNAPANIGGRDYQTTKIGNQIWLAENLDFKFDGLDINPLGQPSAPAAWYFDRNEAQYGKDGTYKCGLLYNWYAIKYLEDNKATLIPGWHVPTDAEWTTLINTVGNNPGTKLKALDGSVTSGFPSGWNGTDDYGFRVLPAGRHVNSSVFDEFGASAYFGTITEYGSNDYRFKYFGNNSSVISNPNPKLYGYSVRLVKDT